jgi:hypothetical protein
LAWVGSVLFGLGLPLFSWLVIRPQSLLLSSDGFILSGGLILSPRQVLWTDIDGFFVYRLPRGAKAIGYNFRSPVRGALPSKPGGRRFGVKRLLPSGWPLSTEEMVETLNRYRLQALSRPLPLSGGEG